MECRHCKKLQRENEVLRYSVVSGAVENFNHMQGLRTQLDWKENQIRKLKDQ